MCKENSDSITVTVPQLAWHGTRGLELQFPLPWTVAVGNMAGHDRPALESEQIRQIIANPVGLPPLQHYFRSKQQVVIIFDDMTRVTRVSDVVPHLLAELAAGGIEDKQVRFIAACGCHGAMSLTDFKKKLGEDIPARFPVYNHSPFSNTTYAGTTSAGTPLFFNTEFLRCDLRIGIGSIVPHAMVGFGGGSKLVLPGVASYETIRALHAPRTKQDNINITKHMGSHEKNPYRLDVDEVDNIGMNIMIDAIVNSWGETCGLFAGLPGVVYPEALKTARDHYVTTVVPDADIVVANTFAKASEAVSGLSIAFQALKPKGGDIVLIVNAPDGQITHYLMGPFGNYIEGELALHVKPPSHVRRVIIFSQYPERASLRYLEDDGRVVMVSKWDEVLMLLKHDYGAEATKVTVFPNADIQFCG